MGRSGARKPRVRKIQRRVTVSVRTDFEHVQQEAKRLCEELKRAREASGSLLEEIYDSEFDEVTEADLTSTFGDTSSSPEPLFDDAEAGCSSWTKPRQTRPRSASQRRRGWRAAKKDPSPGTSGTSSEGKATTETNTGKCQHEHKHDIHDHLKRCSDVHDHLSCKDLKKLKELSENLLSVRQEIYSRLFFSVRFQVLFVDHFLRTIPQLETVEKAMYIYDRLLQWMVSQPPMVLQLARHLYSCSNKTPCQFENDSSASSASGSEESKDSDSTEA